MKIRKVIALTLTATMLLSTGVFATEVPKDDVPATEITPVTESTPALESVFIELQDNKTGFIGIFDKEGNSLDNKLVIKTDENTVITELGKTKDIKVVTYEETVGKLVLVTYGASTRSLPPQAVVESIQVIEGLFEGETDLKEAVAEWSKGLSTTVEDTTESKFSAWAEAQIYIALEQAILPDLIILSRPKESITREEFTNIIMEVYSKMGGKQSETELVLFEDTDSEVLAKASALGIIHGVGDNKFAPDAHITRQEMAVILSRVLNKLEVNIPVTLEIRHYADQEQIAEWAVGAVELMDKLAIIQGVGEGKIDPKANTTIEQAIVVAVRFLGSIGAYQFVQ